MPKQDKKYTAKNFQDDLEELQSMINNSQHGGNDEFAPMETEKEFQLGGNYDNEEDDEQYGGYENEDEDENEYEYENEDNEYYQEGGKSSEAKRHFKLVKLNGKDAHFVATADIALKASPGSAAKKILKSIAHEKKLFGNDKLKLGSVTFVIYETTRGSKNKTYGPYVGKYQKYTPAELKLAKEKDAARLKKNPKSVIIERHMKPVVVLNKSNKMMKGGK